MSTGYMISCIFRIRSTIEIKIPSTNKVTNNQLIDRGKHYSEIITSR